MSQKQNQINIELSDEISKGKYANLAMIAHSSSEFVIDFIQLMPGVPKAKVNSRIIITPEHAKKFSIALNDLDDNIFNQAQNGDLVILRSDTNNKIRGLVKINRLVDVYLYAGRFLEPSVLDAIDRTKLASD